jgi:hypothetical protein
MKTIFVITIGVLTGVAGSIRFFHLHPTSTRERVVPRGDGDIFEHQGFTHYALALPYCKGKAVADMASGTGDGTKMLRDGGARQVDGYDYKPLGQRYVMDFEKESWSTHYDVIVSFETIEHLGNPDFFLGNVERTAGLFLVSTPYGEHNTNEFHKQHWTLAELQHLIDAHFKCRYSYQAPDSAEIISKAPMPHGTLVGVCDPLPMSAKTPF